MNDIRLVALDLDGTLLDDMKKISEADINTVKKLRKNGIHIIFASGRHFDGVKTITDVIGNTDYCISSVGAIVTDSSDRLAYSNCLDAETVRDILAFLHAEGYYVQTYPPLKTFAYCKRTKRTDNYERICGCRGMCMPDMFTCGGFESAKILIADEPEVLIELRTEVQKRYPGYSVLLSQPDHLEIIKPGVSKADALAFILEKLGLKMENVLALGDAEVDISLMKYAAYSGCPSNSVDIIKELSGYVSPRSNNESAVTDIISHFMGDLQ